MPDLRLENILKVLMNPWIVGIGTAIVSGLVLYYLFGIGKNKKIKIGRGGIGGNATVVGSNSVAIGGKGGKGSLKGCGGDGGNASVLGKNSFAMGGEGGNAGEEEVGGRGGRGPLHVLMEDFSEKFKDISEKFGITEDMAKQIGKGGDGGGSSTSN